MLGVYGVSHARALLTLGVRGPAGEPWRQWKLLVFLVVVVQMSDVLQYVWGKLLGRHKIAPHLSPNKTWEGFIAGVLSASLIGMAAYSITPFTLVEAAAISLAIAIMGFFGGGVEFAVQRDGG